MSFIEKTLTNDQAEERRTRIVALVAENCQTIFPIQSRLSSLRRFNMSTNNIQSINTDCRFLESERSEFQFCCCIIDCDVDEYSDPYQVQLMKQIVHEYNLPETSGVHLQTSVRFYDSDTTDTGAITTEFVSRFCKRTFALCKSSSSLEYIQDTLISMFRYLSKDSEIRLLPVAQEACSFSMNRAIEKNEHTGITTDDVVNGSDYVDNIPSSINEQKSDLTKDLVNAMKSLPYPFEDVMEALKEIVQTQLDNRIQNNIPESEIDGNEISISNEGVGSDSLDKLLELANKINEKWNETIAPALQKGLQHINFLTRNKNNLAISRKDSTHTIIAKVIKGALHLDLFTKNLSEFGQPNDKTFRQCKKDLNRDSSERYKKFISEYEKFSKPLKNDIIPLVSKIISDVDPDCKVKSTNLFEKGQYLTSVSEIEVTNTPKVDANIGLEDGSNPFNNVKEVKDNNTTQQNNNNNNVTNNNESTNIPDVDPSPKDDNKEPATLPSNESVEEPLLTVVNTQTTEDKVEANLLSFEDKIKEIIHNESIDSDNKLFQYVIANRDKLKFNGEELETFINENVYKTVTTGALVQNDQRTKITRKIILK